MRKLILLTFLILILASLSGCIRSRVVLTSDPAGADVTFNNYYRGKTPVEIPIIWYWFYDVKLEKDNYKTLEAQERFRAPVWFYMPFDLFCEALPFPIYDTKRRHYALQPEEQI